MAEHSKVASKVSQSVLEIVKKALLGSTQKKAFSASVLVIISYLIYIKNKKSSTDNIKIVGKVKKDKVSILSCSKLERATSMLSSSRESNGSSR
jgi:hypothetical protein